MKKIALLFFYFIFLLSACTKDPKENSTDPTDPSKLTETPTPQESPPQEMRMIRINQDLTLKENPLNIEAAGDLARTYPIYYGNSKCVLANTSSRRTEIDPWMTQKQLKKNEVYKVIGFDLFHRKRKDFPTARWFVDTVFTVYAVSETPEPVHIWIRCYGDEAAQITSPSDIEGLLDNVISFLDGESSATNNFNVFGPSNSTASHLLGTGEEALVSKRILINDDNLTDDRYENEKCSIHIIGGERDYRTRYYEYSFKSIVFQKGHSHLANRSTLMIRFINDFGVDISIHCNGEEFTLSTSFSDVVKLLDGFLYFSE